MSDSDRGTQPTETPSRLPWFRRRWVVIPTLLFVLANGVILLAVASAGASHQRSCGGGFSGYSFSNGCSADLSLQMFESPNPVAAGGRVFYLIEVTNKGPDSADYFTILDAPPKGTVVDWFMSSSGYCSYQGNQIQCQMYGTMYRGQKQAVTIVVRPTRAGTIVNKAYATSDIDPNPSNNKGQIATTVTG